jgi:hypothetical protein
MENKNSERFLNFSQFFPNLLFFFSFFPIVKKIDVPTRRRPHFLEGDAATLSEIPHKVDPRNFSPSSSSSIPNAPRHPVKMVSIAAG